MTRSPLSSRTRARLLTAARKAARRSYSPYSRFRVGAAVLTATGVFTGTNVENASYPLSLCAERTALAAAVAAGAGTVTAIAISCIDAVPSASDELMPCGACRQWFAELAPDAEVIVDGVDRTFTVTELLPAAFRLTARTGAAPRRRDTKPRRTRRAR
jgi:cytidine deaminase